MATGSYFVAFDHEMWVGVGSTSSAAPTSTSGLTRIFSLSDASIKGTSGKTSAIDYETGIGGKKELITEIGYNIPAKMNVSLTDAGYHLMKRTWGSSLQGNLLRFLRYTPVKDGSTDQREIHAGIAWVEGFDSDEAAGNVATVSFTLAGYGNLVWRPQGRAAATLTVTTAGSGLAVATYTNVPLVGANVSGYSPTFGTGTGMLATVVVAGGGTVTAAPTVTAGGTNYTVGQVLTCAVADIGGTGVAPTFTVATVAA